MSNATTEKAISAFYSRSPRRISANTAVVLHDGAVEMVLHGAPIARLEQNGKMFIRTAGWDTKTTKERLGGIPGVNVYHQNFVLMINGGEWKSHSDWTYIGYK